MFDNNIEEMGMASASTAQVNSNEAKPQVSEALKRMRRGITNETRSNARIKFDHERDMNRSNGLFIGHLESIEMKMRDVRDDANIPQFAGMSVPTLEFTFCSNQSDKSEWRYVTQTFWPVESNTLTIPGGKEAWKFDSQMEWIKHVMNVFLLKGGNMTVEQEDALGLPYYDFDEKGEYVPVEPQVIVDGWRQVYSNYVAIMENNGRPVYRDPKGHYIPIWMKLIRYIKQGNEWKPVVKGKSTEGDLAFPQFVGEGIIEVINATKQPTLRINKLRESVSYKETKKEMVQPNIQPGSGMPMGVPVSPFDDNTGGFNSTPNMYGNETPSVVADPDELPF